MKFLHYFYIPIIIFGITRGIECVADFTLKELTHISRELNPMECMRLIEAIYLAIPRVNRDRYRRETDPAVQGMKISEQTCLDELKAWNNQFPDKAEPKARFVMVLHLNALGRPDLANYVRKYRKTLPLFGDNVAPSFQDNYQGDIEIANHGVFKRHANIIDGLDGYPRMKKIHRRMKRGKIRRSISHIAELGSTSTNKNETEKLRRALTVSQNSLFVVIALVVVVIFICAMVLIIFRKLLSNSVRCNNRSNFCTRTMKTQEKGLQCISRQQDGGDDSESRSNCAGSPISEIDIEGGSCSRSLHSVESRKTISNGLSHNESVSPVEISIEKLELSDEDRKYPEDLQLPSSCRCRPLEEAKICVSKSRKKKKCKKKCKKSKDETKTTRSYLKAMQEKILPKPKSTVKKDCTFDMKQFQDKVLKILNQECGVCQCCDCTQHHSRVKEKSTKREESCCQRSGKRSKNCRKSSGRNEWDALAMGGDNEVQLYQTSLISNSPDFSGIRKLSRIKHNSAESMKSCRIKGSENIIAALSASSFDSVRTDYSSKIRDQNNRNKCCNSPRDKRFS